MCRPLSPPRGVFCSLGIVDSNAMCPKGAILALHGVIVFAGRKARRHPLSCAASKLPPLGFSSFARMGVVQCKAVRCRNDGFISGPHQRSNVMRAYVQNRMWFDSTTPIHERVFFSSGV
jgi:hypothetical protein